MNSINDAEPSGSGPTSTRTILLWALTIALIMTLFPPFGLGFQNEGGSIGFKFLGYYFFLAPPKNAYIIDWSRLTIQYLLVVIASGMLHVYRTGISTRAGEGDESAD